MALTYLKRTKLYLLRKKGKTIGMFTLLLVIGTFLLLGFSILATSEDVATEMREALGAAFYLRPTINTATDESGQASVLGAQVSMTIEAIEEIMQTGNIRYYNVQNNGYVKSDSLTFIPGAGYNVESCMGQITSLNYSALNTDFTGGTAELQSGRHITVMDKAAILISSDLAKTSGLSVGDMITLTHALLEETDGVYGDAISEKTAFTDVTVIGIYETSFAADGADTPTAGKAANHLYCSLDVLDTLGESEPGVYTGEAAFFVADPQEMIETVGVAKKVDSVDWPSYFVWTNDFQYQKIADGLSSLERLVTILLLCVSIVSTIVLILILTLRMRVRMQESGILLAAGISKWEILKQYLMEAGIVAVAASVFAVVLCSALSMAIGSVIFADLQPAALDDGAIMGITQTARTIKMGLPAWETLVILTAEILATATAIILSATSMLRMKPKEILSKMS